MSTIGRYTLWFTGEKWKCKPVDDVRTASETTWDVFLCEFRGDACLVKCPQRFPGKIRAAYRRGTRSKSSSSMPVDVFGIRFVISTSCF